MFLSYDNTVHARCQIRNECALLLNSHIQFSNVNSFCHNFFCCFWSFALQKYAICLRDKQIAYVINIKSSKRL